MGSVISGISAIAFGLWLFLIFGFPETPIYVWVNLLNSFTIIQDPQGPDNSDVLYCTQEVRTAPAPRNNGVRWRCA